MALRHAAEPLSCFASAGDAAWSIVRLPIQCLQRMLDSPR